MRNFGNHSFCRNDQTGNGCRILQSRSDNLRRVDNTGLDHIDIFAFLRIIAKIGIIAFKQLTDNQRAVNTGIFGNLTYRRLQSPADNIYTDFLILVGGFQFIQSFGRIQQSTTAARDNAFFNRGSGCMQRVINTVFLFFNLNF